MNLILKIASKDFAFLRLIVGAGLISLSGVFVKLTSIGPTASGFWRVALGGLMLVAILKFTRRKVFTSGISLFWLTLAGVAFAIDLFAWHRAVINVGVGLSTLLGNFQVFVMAAAAVFVFNEKMSKTQLIAIPMAMLGLYLIVGIEWSSTDQNTKAGVWYGLATAVAYTAYLLSLRQARWSAPHRDAASDLAVASIISALGLWLIAQYVQEPLAITNWTDMGLMSAYAFIGQVLGWLLISSSLPYVPTVHIGLALLLQPTLAYVWDVVIFKRTLGILELCGALIAILAIYFGSKGRSEQI